MKDFRNKVVVITGAGSGIGRATALAFAREGARLHLTDINRERIEAAAQEIRALGAEATPYVVDSADREAVAKFADEVYARAGRVDVLHNNAGIAVGAPFEKTSLEDWEKVLSVNLWGVIYGMHYFVPRMIAQGGGGHIVNTASGAGLIGLPAIAPYTASKFAVVGLSETASIELRPYGIYVTALCPGIIYTNILKDSKVELYDAQGRSRKDELDRLYQRWGVKPERVARDVLQAIRKKRPVQPSPYHMYPPWILKRISVRLYQAVARVAVKFLLGG
jgi:NAD(P)-dependent dehydrogenase (short-subunit alcohol dehydrogenase family)